MGKLDGRTIAFIVDDNFEQVEYTRVRDALEAEGAETELLSVNKGEVKGLHHVEPGDTFPVDEVLDRAVPDDYDVIVFPGGTVNADGLRRNETAQTWLRTFDAQNKPVALICHAPWLAVSAGVVEGHSWTSWPSLEDDINNAGGEWSDEDVVVDGNYITSRKPDDIPAFVAAIVDALS